MGIFHSKKNSKEVRDSNLAPNQIQTYDDEIVNRLRKELNDNTEMFLVNNILMSIQFYENFEREMEDLRKNQVSEREIEINKTLADYQKHCLLPDTVMECINERVRFRPYHGDKKYESQSLLPQRMFIVHDNIEILYEGETSEYSTVDGPIHRAVLERAENPGYVQLRQVEFLNVGKNEDDNDSNSESKDDIKENSPKEDSLKENSPKEKSVTFGAVQSSPPPTPGKRLFAKNASPSPIIKENQFIFTDNMSNEIRTPIEPKRSSLKNKLLRNNSFTLTSSPKLHNKMKEAISADNIQKEVEISPKPILNDQDYGYTTLRRLTASKPLDEVRSHRNVSGITVIPSYCIKEIKVRKIMYDSESDSDDSLMEDGRRKPPKRKEIKDFYDYKKYFNSIKFVGHFGDVYETLYCILGFTDESFANATVQSGIIYCEGKDKNGNKIVYEIIPTVATSWPDVAFEWHKRYRPAISDPSTKKIYQWPTELMKKKILALQTNVLPIGFLAKRGNNENQELEWSLSFPAAERYMETCMSHSQVRCYLFVLALYKTFMEPSNTKLGLAPHHILNIIFWECEKNYVTWPEDRLGAKLIKILNLLYNYLSKGYLPDYFVRERNLFESLPSKYLRISQSKLHDIIENPILHILIAMRNLRYTSGNFFPPLNFKSLYRILSESDSLKLINPHLANMVEINTDQSIEPEEAPNEFKENEIPFWSSAKKTEDRERQWKLNLRKQIELQNKEKQENLKQMRRASVDSIDLQVNIPKFDTFRKKCVLEFFIVHFTEVATKCIQYEAYNYALVILEHARSLAILLAEEPSGEIEARKCKKAVNDLIDKCRREQQQAMQQANNNRDSRNFTGVRFLDHNLNMTNLQNSFMHVNNQDEEVVSRKKKRPGNIKISADVHNIDVSSPAKTPSQKSVQLEENDALHETTGNINISADVHNVDVPSPAKTPSQNSVQLEDNDALHETTDL